MNGKAKAVVGFLRELAVGVGMTSAYVCLDQTVRSLTNEFIKKKSANKDKQTK